MDETQERFDQMEAARQAREQSFNARMEEEVRHQQNRNQYESFCERFYTRQDR